MVRVFIESLMGDWGGRLLAFYDAYSLYINLVVVLYGMFIILAWTNLKNVRNRLIQAIVTQLLDIPGLDVDMQPKKALHRVMLPWESAAGQLRFPYVAQQSALWPRRASVQVIQQLLPAEDLAREALKQIAGRNSRARKALP